MKTRTHQPLPRSSASQGPTQRSRVSWLAATAAFGALICGTSSVSSRASSVPSYSRSEVNPLTAPQRLQVESNSHPRLLEPASPVIGKDLLERIQNDSRHPAEIHAAIVREYPEVHRDLKISAIAYFKMMRPHLIAYCNPAQGLVTTPPEGGWTTLETNAIPQQIAVPLHPEYREALASTARALEALSPDALRARVQESALDFRSQRADCPAIAQLDRLEARAKKVFPNRWDRMLDLHREISTPEASFPRIQFGVNGFTQFVYDELLRLHRLPELLRIAYDAQAEWIAAVENGGESNPVAATRMFSHIEAKLMQAGFKAREALLALAYSTRTVSSIDVHYGFGTEQSLLLEVYFWKFRVMRDYVGRKHLERVFPNRVITPNPGLYHYATASLLGCVLRQHKYSGPMSRAVTLVNKIGYKVDKLFKDLRGRGKDEGERVSVRRALDRAKAQGFGPGVQAGWYGGGYGIRLCREEMRRERKLSRDAVASEEAAEAELEAYLLEDAR